MRAERTFAAGLSRFASAAAFWLLVVCEAAAGGQAETKLADWVPEDVSAILDRTFTVCMERPSRWEEVRAAQRAYYDIAGPLGKSASLEEACRPFAVPGFLVRLGSRQLQQHGHKWAGLSLAQRHRVLDYLLALNSAGDFFVSKRYLPSILGKKDAARAVSFLTFALKGTKPVAEKMAVRHLGRHRVAFACTEWLCVVSAAGGADLVRAANSPQALAGGDPMGATLAGISDAAVAAGKPSAYVALRFKPWVTTHVPSILLKLEANRWVKIDTPRVGPLSRVALSPRGDRLAVGTEIGEVLTRDGAGEWAVHKVFDGDRVDGLFFAKGRLLAVSHRGAVAVREKTWKPMRLADRASLLSCAADAEGAAFLLFSDGRLETVTRRAKAGIDYTSVIPKEHRSTFAPRAVLAWGGGPCVWGVSAGRTIVVVGRLGTEKPVPFTVGDAGSSPAEGALWWEDPLSWQVIPWSEDELIVIRGFFPVVLDRRGRPSLWKPYQEFLKALAKGRVELQFPE